MSERVGSEVSVGSRVVDESGCRATVRYIGPVKEGDESVWWGVEWDDPSRGKHDGCVLDPATGASRRFFHCRVGGASGSFVRPKKMTSGVSLVDALRTRYLTLEAASSLDSEAVVPDPSRQIDQHVLRDAFVSTSRGSAKAIEFYGESKIRRRQQLSDLVNVAVRGDQVSHIGSSVEELSTLAGHVEELDLQDNLISSWRTIAEIGAAMPSLHTLLLHANLMENPSDELFAALHAEFGENLFSNLRVLALNGCAITGWSAVDSLASMFPSLQELYVARNDLGDVTPGTAIFPTLRVMDLSRCNIADWSSIEELSKRAPALEELILDGNAIPEVCPPPTNTFNNLVRLSFAETQLSSWKSIDALDKFPSLAMVRVSAAPLFAGLGASEVRPLVIARVAGLRVFNGSAVSARERSDAEKTYLRVVLREKANLVKTLIISSGADAEEAADKEATKIIEGSHPRYSSLMSQYGADLIPPSAAGNAGQTSMSSEIIEVCFRNLTYSHAGQAGDLEEKIRKRVPRSMTVSRVKLLARQLFKVEPRLQRLTIRQQKSSPPTYLDDDESTLEYYGAADGTEIFVQEEED